MKPLSFIAKNVPTALREINSWLLWKLVKGRKADNSITWLKVPYYADGTKRRGILGTKDDRAHLVSFDEAVKVFNEGGFAGVGFATMPEYPLTILDLDKCIDADTGEYSKFALKVVDTGTYVERSPSGLGLRAVYTGEAVCQGKRNGFIESGERVEIYCGSAFVTITGHVLDKNHRVPVALPKAVKKTLMPVIAGNGSGSTTVVTDGDGDALMPIEAAPLPDFGISHAKVVLNKLPESWGSPGHGTWYRVAAALHLQFQGSDEAYALLDEWSQGLDGYDEESNRKRWDAGFSHSGGREGITTMRNLVFESIQNGGLRVKPETMQKWGLARKVEEEDFEPEPEEAKAVLPTIDDMDAWSDIKDMLDEKAPPVDWLVEGLLPRGYVTALAGGSGTSKSYCTLQMCAYGAVGFEAFAGMKICDGGFSTLYLAYEDSRITLHHRVRVVAEIAGVDVRNSDVLGEDQTYALLRSNLRILAAERLDDGAWQLATAKRKFEPMVETELAEYLREYITSRRIDLVVIDTGSEVHTGDENAAGDMVTLMRILRQLATGANCAVLVIQHVGKDIWGKRLAEINQASLRGSGVLVDKARNVVVLARMPVADAALYDLPKTQETHDRYIVMKHVKANLGEYVPQKVFERASQGSLIYSPQIQQLDPSLVMQEEQEETDEIRANRNAKRQEMFQNYVIEYLTAENASGNEPNSTEMFADLVNRYPLMGDAAARQTVQYLVKEGIIGSYPSKTKGARSNLWKIKRHK